MRFIFKRRLNIFDISCDMIGIMALANGWIITACFFVLSMAFVSVMIERKLGFNYEGE